jgi:hypothetical protein
MPLLTKVLELAFEANVLGFSKMGEASTELGTGYTAKIIYFYSGQRN